MLPKQAREPPEAEAVQALSEDGEVTPAMSWLPGAETMHTSKGRGPGGLRMG